MIKILLVACLVLISCTAAKQVELTSKLELMAGHLNKLDAHAREEKFQSFEAEVKGAEAIRDNLSNFVDSIESAELKSRAQIASDYLHLQFRILVEDAKLMQDLKRLEPFVEELYHKDISHISETRDLANATLNRIVLIREFAPVLEQSSERLHPSDASSVHSADALMRMHSLLSDLKSIEFNMKLLLEKTQHLQ